MSCKVIFLNPVGRLGTDPARIKELPGFTHYLVSKRAVQRVKKMLAKCEDNLEDARVTDCSEATLADIGGEIAGMKYTLQTLGISIK